MEHIAATTENVLYTAEQIAWILHGKRPAPAPMAPYFAEALKDVYASATSTDPNVRMILRDGPARPAVVAPAAIVTTTAHPAIAGLTRFSGGSHLLGAAGVVVG